jgi:hypothetical protein
MNNPLRFIDPSGMMTVDHITIDGHNLTIIDGHPAEYWSGSGSHGESMFDMLTQEYYNNLAAEDNTITGDEVKQTLSPSKAPIIWNSEKTTKFTPGTFTDYYRYYRNINFLSNPKAYAEVVVFYSVSFSISVASLNVEYAHDTYGTNLVTANIIPSVSIPGAAFTTGYVNTSTIQEYENTPYRQFCWPDNTRRSNI